jgi:hypothetical protein
MARQFGSYSPLAPLGVTWEEELILTDENDAPIDLTGYSVRAQFREEVPELDPETGEPATDPVFELTTADWYDSAPSWDVFDVVTVTPAEGKIEWALPVDDLWTASPDNFKRKLVWSMILVRDDGYAIPVVQGKATFRPATTV